MQNVWIKGKNDKIMYNLDESVLVKIVLARGTQWIEYIQGLSLLPESVFNKWNSEGEE